MEEIGPVEYMIVSFPGNRFTGEIAPALADLVESNTIRIIDLAFVSKDADGTILVLPYERQVDDPDRVRLDELPQGRRDLACEPVARKRHDHVLDGADLFHHYLRFSAVMPYNLVVARFPRTP